MTQDLHNIEGDVRCKNCNKLVAKVLTDGQFEIKCSRCSTLNAIFEKSVKKIFVVGLEGHILFLSEAMELASGYQTEDAIGKKPSDLWGRNKPPEFYSDLWNTVRGERKTLRFSMINKHRAGDLYFVDLAVSPVFDTDDAIIFFVGVETTANVMP